MRRVQVFLIRHGETDWNLHRRFQGQTDIPLNKTGEAQALELGRKLLHLKPEIFLSSDLQRALRTAELANSGLGLEIHRHPGLREGNLGVMEGRFRDDVIASLGPDEWAKWSSGDPAHLDFALPGGETKRQVLERSIACIKEFIMKHHLVTRVAVCSHGGVVSRLASHAMAVPTANVSPLSLKNCVIHEVEYEFNVDRWSYVRQID
ncbi:MAG TPA: histidine phosphatase family protein [Bdellovibrionales bacterium]|nr:histidine phosphatase family protein [Bdellovibrionales bacterium]